MEIRYTLDYYKAEKHSAISLLILAFLAVGIAYTIFNSMSHGIVYGFSYGLLALSILQMISALMVWVKSTIKERKLMSGKLNKHDLESEYLLIKKKVARYPKIRAVQEVFFGLSFIIIFLGMAEVINPIKMGIGLALILTMTIWIVTDLFAQRRAEEYGRFLRRMITEN